MTKHPVAYDCVCCAAELTVSPENTTYIEWLNAFLTDAIAQRSTDRMLEACHEHEPDLAAAILRRQGRPLTAREVQVSMQKRLLDQTTRPRMREELTKTFGGLAANPPGTEHHAYFKGEYEEIVKDWLDISDATADSIEAAYQAADDRHRAERARMMDIYSAQEDEGHDDA